MTWIVIAAFALFVGIVIDIWKRKQSKLHMPTVTASILMFSVIVVGALNSFFSIPKNSEKHQSPIYAIGDTSKTNGHFFLGSGQVNSEPAFMFYIGDGNAVRLLSVYASNATIYYTDEKPYMTYICKSNKYKKNVTLFQDKNCSVENGVEFFIPRGSIKNNYSLDAQ